MQANDNVLVRGEDQRLFFTRQADGSFGAAAGGRARLSAVADGYELLRHDQVRYRFDPQDRLTSLRERNGQGLTLAYDASGRLQHRVESH